MFFFFQAEDGIRDGHVTGVQTCALPISPAHFIVPDLLKADAEAAPPTNTPKAMPIVAKAAKNLRRIFVILPDREYVTNSFAWLSDRNGSRDSHMPQQSRSDM